MRFTPRTAFRNLAMPPAPSPSTLDIRLGHRRTEGFAQGRGACKRWLNWAGPQQCVSQSVQRGLTTSALLPSPDPSYSSAVDEKPNEWTLEGAAERCLFKLTSDALIVANTGRPFSRQGVISICYAHLSEKGKVPPTDDYEAAPTGLVEAIARRTFKVYQDDKNRIGADSVSEDELQRDYGGRFTWELLQNADDACATEGATSSELIGAKGIGFKSALEITDEPEIHSGPFHFLFSPRKTRDLLRQLIPDPPLLTFQIPHCVLVSEEIAGLLEEFRTVIRLPFRDVTAHARTRQRLERWASSGGATVLLLCQHIAHLKLEFEQTSVCWQIRSRPALPFDDGDIQVDCERDGRTLNFTFRRWADSWHPEGAVKKLSVAAMLPLDVEHKPQPFEEALPLHVFFPTDEFPLLRALLHASFDPDTSRKHVRSSPHDSDILDREASLIERVIQSVPAEVVLRALMPSGEAPPDSIACSIQKRILEKLKAVEFIPCIGGRKQRVGMAKLYESYLGPVLDSGAPELAGESLTDPSLVGLPDCCDVLKRLGAPNLVAQDYPRFLRFCRNKTLPECKEALTALVRVVDQFAPPSYHTSERAAFPEACRAVPCWWTQQGHARDLAQWPPLLRPPLSEELPPWIRVDVLSEVLAESLKKVEENRKQRPVSDDLWREILEERLLLVSDRTLLERVLASALRDKTTDEWWERCGWEALRLFAKWSSNQEPFEKIEPIPMDFAEPSEERRAQLAAVLRLPTDKGWIAASQCYAGSGWDGPSSFDHFFATIPNRGILLSPDKWPTYCDEERDKWKRMLRWAGVSWEPKLLRYEASEGASFYESPDNPFAPFSWNYWDKYCTTLEPESFDRRCSFTRDPKLTVQWALEFFPECLAGNASAAVLRLIRPLVRQVNGKASHMNYKFSGRGNDRRTGRVESLAFYQIHRHQWLKAKPSVLFPDPTSAPDATYLPGKSLCGLLPEIAVAIADDQEGRNLASFLVQDLRIHDGPPGADDPRWREWLDKLPAALSQPATARNHEDAIRALYKRLLAFPECPVWLRHQPLAKIACERWNPAVQQSEIEFLRPREVYYLDEPHLDAARAELVRHLPIFLLRLDEGQRAVEWFNLRDKLSAVVKITPHWDADCDQPRIAGTYELRKPALRAMLRRELAAATCVREVRHLRIRISREQDQIATAHVAAWNEDGQILVDADEGPRGLAIALARMASQPKLADSVENILRAKDDEEVKQRLRDFGIPEEAIREAVPPLPPTQKVPSGQTEPVQAKQNDQPTAAGSEQRQSRSQGGDSVGTRTRQPGQGAGDVPLAESTDRGQKAEAWLRNRIQAVFGSECAVSDGPVRDDQNRETDILVTLGHREFHIEVKHLEGRTIYWSDLEVSKAQDHPGNYHMALVSPEASTEEYSVRWLWNPLSQLLAEKRSGVWLWNESRYPASLEIEEWSVPAQRPNRPAERFAFRIDVTEQFVEALPQGLEELKLKLRTSA